MGHMQEGQPTAWATYVSVADADETAAKVKAAGGSVMVEPMDVMDIGRMAFFADPDRRGVRRLAAEDVRRRRPRQRAQLAVLERGAARATPTPTRRSTRPSSAGRPAARRSRARPRRYTVWELDGKPVGGMMQMTDE